MAGTRGKGSEVGRQKGIIKRYRSLVDTLLEEAESYTDGMNCPFCSGYDGYESANDREGGEIKHARRCPTRKAEKLAAEKI